MHLNISKEVLFKRGGVLDAILDTSFDQALIIDKSEKIVFFSKSSELSSGRKAEDTVGLQISELIKDNKFTEVLKTGGADKGSLLIIHDKVAVANHIPVKDNGEIIGAIGIVYFSNVSSIKKLLAELTSIHSKEHQELYNNLSRKGNSYTIDDYIGKSDCVKRLKENIVNAANSSYPILMIGETGTGKEILANAIHAENRRTFLQPFVKINCSSIPNSLLESELFGYEKGAFTGAVSTKLGKFEIASNGSILLDEIGEMDISLQAKLLRVLEENEFERVGGNKLIPTNVRIVASTNVDLRRLSREKRFRQDLYYRLNTLEIKVPPLRERIEDIPLLMRHFIDLKKIDVRFKQEAVELLMQYDWPGNVRELRNVINRFGVLKKSRLISYEDVKEAIYEMSFNEGGSDSSRLKKLDPILDSRVAKKPLISLEEHEKELICQTLCTYQYNQVKTAKKLNIARTTLTRKIKKYGIDIPNEIKKMG